MIFSAAYRALQRIFTSQYRSMVLGVFGFSCACVMLIWLSVYKLFVSYFWPWIIHFFPHSSSVVGWLGLSALIIFNLGLVFVMAFLIAPITAMIGGFFVDNAAEIIEKEDYPDEPIGRAMPFGRSVVLSLKFLILSLFGNGIALILFFIPGVNFVAFYVINGYLLGREYFLFTAYRFQSEQEARISLRTHCMTVFGAGVLIALFVSVPIFNLITPLFATALMTHLYKTLSHRTFASVSEK
ncbi:sulfate transporter family protein [Bartonella ancashensis]|nr:sulfate transporter family protein [Bartonella ancashensis]